MLEIMNRMNKISYLNQKLGHRLGTVKQIDVEYVSNPQKVRVDIIARAGGWRRRMGVNEYRVWKAIEAKKW